MMRFKTTQFSKQKDKKVLLQYVLAQIASALLSLVLAVYASGQRVNKARIVHLMPQVIGMRYDDAVNEVRKRYAGQIRKRVQEKEGPTDVVLEQYPQDGDPLARVPLVILTVSVNAQVPSPGQVPADPQVSTSPTVTPTATGSPTATQTVQPTTPTPRASVLPTNTPVSNRNSHDSGNGNIKIDDKNDGDDWWLVGIIGGGLLIGGGASATAFHKARLRKWRRLIDAKASISRRVDVSVGPVEADGPGFAVDASIGMGRVEFSGAIEKRMQEHK